MTTTASQCPSSSRHAAAAAAQACCPCPTPQWPLPSLAAAAGHATQAPACKCPSLPQELYAKFGPIYAAEEEERSAKWDAFLADLRALVGR